FPFREKRYTGRYSRKFNFQDDAEEFVRDLQGRSLVIHHSPRWPMLSMAMKDDVDALLLTRAPEPPANPTASAWQPASVPFIKKLLAYPLMLAALAGFLLSLCVHVATWFGQTVLPESARRSLLAGMFVTLVAGILLSPRRLRRWRHSRDALDGFVGMAMIVVFIYAMANFILFTVSTAQNYGHAAPLQELRGVSGHWMLFYCW